MKFAIMQPYFFPYIGHFDLIYQADFWVVFDTPSLFSRVGSIGTGSSIRQVGGSTS